jgi:hypothetical protein
MKKYLAAGIAAFGLALVATDYADAATRGGFGGGGFRGGFGGFRGGLGGFRGGFRGGAFIGPAFGFGFYDPFWWPYWSYPWAYPGAYPYLPPESVAQYPGPAGYGAPLQQYWYRCGNPEGYYPYIRNCNTGWEQVPATPPNAPGPPGAPPPPP